MKLGENIFLFTPANILISNSDEQTSYQETNSAQKEILFKEAASY